MTEMLEKLEKVCSNSRLRDMYMVDVENQTLEAFEKVGYVPSETVKKAMDRTWVNSDRNEFLYEFAYNVWRVDSNE